MDKTIPATHVKKQQQRNLIIVASVVVLVLFGLSYFMDNKSESSKTKDPVETVNFATPLNHVDAQAIWIERAQNQLAEQGKTTTSMEQQLQLLQQAKEAQDRQTQQQTQILETLQTKVTTLTQQLAQRRPQSQGMDGSAAAFPPAPGMEGSPNQGDGFISDDTLNLAPQKNALNLIPLKNPETFVPAGSFVRAITLGAADVSAGVTSQGNPSPMLFRILDQGTLPNHQHSHLKNCVATAAAIGDISSERGEVRLERLSCVNPNGQVVEYPVEATVFGPDGKNGVRGNPLWREGALVQRAFIAGTLSGISNGVAQSYTSNSISPWGSVQTVSPSKIFQYGLAQGVGNAAEKLANYNIRRAEQYHPVIQLSAGTVVDIVFLKGFYLDGKKHSENEEDLLATNNTNTTAETIPDSSWMNPGNTTSNPANGGPAPLPLTPQQIQTLKQKNAEQGYQ